MPNPSVIAEMFGDTMLVNGTVYPQCRGAGEAVPLPHPECLQCPVPELQLLQDDGLTPDGVTIVNGVATESRPAPTGWCSGPKADSCPTRLMCRSKAPFDPGTPGGSLITGNAERWDVIVDFTGLAGNSYILYNDAPAPFPGGDPRNDYYLGNPLNPVGPAQPGFGPDTRDHDEVHVSFRRKGRVSGHPDEPVRQLETGINPGSIRPLIPWAQIANGTFTIPSRDDRPED